MKSCILFGIGIAVMAASVAQACPPCDYTNPVHVRESLEPVERGHFNSDVENLVRGKSSAYVVRDITYVLGRFPNHHRALNSVGRLWQYAILENQVPKGAQREETPDYWFRRAQTFAPHDAVLPHIYGNYLFSVDRHREALEQYQLALEFNPDSPDVNYNVGLLYFELKDYELANDHAGKAYDLGYPLAGLRNKLMSVGAWTDGQQGSGGTGETLPESDR